MIKNENQYLYEHITSDIEAGIDHFYIYDDNSDIPVEEFLKNNYPDLLQYCTINVIDDNFPVIEMFGNNQIRCYRHALINYGSETVWMSYTDTDEIWEGDLKKYFKQKEDYHSVFIPWTLHGSNGLLYKNDKTMKENFYDHVIPLNNFRRLRGDNYTDFMYLGKTVSQCDKIKELDLFSDIHFTLPLSEITRAKKWELCDTDCDYWTDPVKDVILNGKEPEIKLHHYFYRSLEELLIKRSRGYSQLVESDPHPRNGNTKEGVERWVDTDWLDFDRYFDLNPEIKYNDEEVSRLFYKFNINYKAYYKQNSNPLTYSLIENNPQSAAVKKHRLIVEKLNRKQKK